MICMNTKILQLIHPAMIRRWLWLDDGFNACTIDVSSACIIVHVLKKQILVDKNHESIVASLKDGLYL